MSIHKSIYSSNKDSWETPQWLFDKLDAKYHFTLDPCADDSNHKCVKYYDEYQNGLMQDWSGETVFCNPPYGRHIDEWVKKCHDSAFENHQTVVMLLPVRTDTNYFHEYIYGQAEIEFIRGRLKFGNAENNAPFPSMIVIFGGAMSDETDKPVL